jgi:2-oxoglutarate ferredoxin oxidoreductase subunit beta
MLYIVENNGVYGLTKGQFSATSDKGSKSKRGVVNHDAGVDMVSLALQMGASYVARSFSGDKEQLVPLIKAGLAHKGAAFIDCISPCVQFNNHPGSTKSFDYVREHNEAVNRLDVITPRDPIHVAYKPGETVRVQQHDGSILSLHKLAELYNPNNRAQALGYLQARQARGQIVTGLLFVDPEARDLHDNIGTVETPLNQLGEAELVPGQTALERINASLR